MKYPFRIPLVLFTPKSLLRFSGCVSELSDFTGEKRFREIIEDDFVTPKSVKRALLCSGKVYYDLLEKQQSDQRKDVAILRLEQLYPTPLGQLQEIVKKFPAMKELVWVQEEPRNMGAWPSIRIRFGDTMFGHQLTGVTRTESASPATGSGTSHKIEQQAILKQAFEIE